MTYAFLLYPHANVRYRQSLLQLAVQELAMTLTALGREAEVTPKEMGGATFLTFEAAKLTERDMRMLSQLASVYMLFSMEDGRLTMIATVLVETGSRRDDIIFEEFKGTGNAEIKLDRALSEARIFPAIDLAKSGTRHEELLLSPAECEGVAMVRRMLGQGHTREATAQLISMLLKTEKNEDFFKRLKEWLAIWEKEGYTIRSLRSGV